MGERGRGGGEEKKKSPANKGKVVDPDNTNPGGTIKKLRPPKRSPENIDGKYRPDLDTADFSDSPNPQKLKKFAEKLDANALSGKTKPCNPSASKKCSPFGRIGGFLLKRGKKFG